MEVEDILWRPLKGAAERRRRIKGAASKQAATPTYSHTLRTLRPDLTSEANRDIPEAPPLQ